MLGLTLTELKEFFQSRSIPAFVVGGYIRDALRGVDTKDLDIAVQGDFLALGHELAAAAGGTCVPLGHTRPESSSTSNDHRVARIVTASADGSGWNIDLSGIEPSIEVDLLRRDFTVDAMALSLDNWGTPEWEERIVDPFGGRTDLANRTIRAIGPSVFQDDPSRLLRAPRLAATLAFGIDRGTANLITQDANLITSTAGERVRDELLGIISLDGAKKHLDTLDELGLLCCIIPELGAAKGVEQPKEHYWDVFSHSLHSVEGVERVTSGHTDDPISGLVPWDDDMDERFRKHASDGHTQRTMLKLGALLHDIAKPQTKMVDDTGRTRFLGHHTLGASMSTEVLQRLRMSNHGMEMTYGMIEHHLRPTQMSQGGELPTPRAIFRYFRDVGDVAIDTLYLSLGDHIAARGPEIDMLGWRRHVDISSHILEVGTQQHALESKPRLVTGHDLIRELDLSPGPYIGELLNELQEAHVAGEFETLDGALAWARQSRTTVAIQASKPMVPGS